MGKRIVEQFLSLCLWECLSGRHSPPTFSGWFCKNCNAVPFFATNPIFALFIEKLKKFQPPALVGGIPAHGLSGHFQPKPSCGCKRVWNLGSSTGSPGGNSSLENPCPWQKELLMRFNTGLQPKVLWYVLKTMLGLCFSLWFWCSWMCLVFLMLCSAIGGKNVNFLFRYALYRYLVTSYQTSEMWDSKLCPRSGFSLSF